ncbi:type II toxin-antitoxin system RelE family toxin [Gemelliphila palaticanis]|uniref:Type II toxin-antitoxin system RelE/ParE family toxin n=1 Tax=Gemelliphila palaticanis TaxID=81950 RepID=A0ABX2T0H8_9BACL|nr:type II toxin-antitoxin system RelE/ParE family toxin [Gemella palaticanis]MBF0716115.1 type II toxin-antitoxin system RelE/ParE family toxin [Gemella palaticanis]NYS48045.1 type II toxin-antitoxin system RelE/ParE family toxin [Gemella palaticanis]
MKEIIFSKSALKFLKKQNKNTQIRLIKAIKEIPNGDIKKLQGFPFKRLRVGTYRVIFNEEGLIINIINIGNRGDIYK